MSKSIMELMQMETESRVGAKYYYYDGYCSRMTHFSGSLQDIYNLSLGNYFETRDDAEEYGNNAMATIRLILEKQLADEGGTIWL